MTQGPLQNESRPREGCRGWEYVQRPLKEAAAKGKREVVDGDKDAVLDQDEVEKEEDEKGKVDLLALHNEALTVRAARESDNIDKEARPREPVRRSNGELVLRAL